MERNDSEAPREDEDGRRDDRNELEEGSPIPDPEADQPDADDVPEAD